MDALRAYREPDQLPPSEPARVAKLLGFRNPEQMTDLGMADHVANGLPVRVLDLIEPILRLIAADALYSVVSESTLRRAKKGKCALTKEPSERIYDVSRVIDQAAKTFRGDGAAVARFLNRPNPILEGRTPFEVARSSSPGAEVVVKLLRKARDGVAV